MDFNEGFSWSIFLFFFAKKMDVHFFTLEKNCLIFGGDKQGPFFDFFSIFAKKKSGLEKMDLGETDKGDFFFFSLFAKKKQKKIKKNQKKQKKNKIKKQNKKQKKMAILKRFY